ncbi:hypothetical protein D3C85_1544040 [compost metagenome]
MQIPAFSTASRNVDCVLSLDSILALVLSVEIISVYTFPHRTREASTISFCALLVGLKFPILLNRPFIFSVLYGVALTAPIWKSKVITRETFFKQ